MASYQIVFLGDGLRHFAYQKEKMFYNGVTLVDIHGESRTNVNGIQGTCCLIAFFPHPLVVMGDMQYGPKKVLSEEVSF